LPFVGQVFKRTKQLSAAYRDVGRLREIVMVLLNHGFGFLLENVDIPGMGRIKARHFRTQPALSAPERALRVIADLGPTYVKIGQILSTRPDLVPAEFIEAFQTLQDNVSPLGEQAIRQVIRDALKNDPESVFAAFDPTPLASASIAQVHRARLRTGEEVVLKVRRPGVRSTILKDLEILLFLARQIERNFPEATWFDLSGIVKEIETSIKAETDFLVEAGNLRRFAMNFQDKPEIKIPTVYRKYTTSSLLTMEYLPGIKITKAREAGCNMEVVGQRYLDAAFKMLFQDGFFHGDLHPGNVIVMENDVLGFIDFGMVGRLTPEMKDNVIDCMFGLLTMDFRTIARIFWEIGIKDESVSHTQFEADVVEVMERHLVGKSISDLQMGQFFTDILDGAVRHRIRVPTNYTMLFKALVTTEGMAKMLVPDVNPLERSRPYIETLVKERYSLDRFSREYYYHLSTLGRLLNRLPFALSQLFSDIEERKLKLAIDVNMVPGVRKELRRIDDRRLMGGVAVGAMVAGSLALDFGPPVFFGLPLVSTLLFLLAAAAIVLLVLGYPRRGE